MDTRFAAIVVPEKQERCAAHGFMRNAIPYRRNPFRSIVTGHSATVTADSGNRPKSVTFDQNDRSRSAEISGHVAPKSPVTSGRNTH
jgi:hypothetical protein